MGWKKRLKNLKRELGEEEGTKEWYRVRAHKRAKTLKMLEGMPVIGAIAKLFLKV